MWTDNFSSQEAGSKQISEFEVNQDYMRPCFKITNKEIYKLKEIVTWKF